MQNSYRIPNLHELKLDQPYNFTVDLQQHVHPESLNSVEDVMRWTDGKASIGAPISIFTIFIMRKEVLPIQQAGSKKKKTPRHLNKHSCSQSQLQFGSNTIYERCKGAPSLAIPASFLVSLITLSNCSVGQPEMLENAFSRQQKHVAAFLTHMSLTVML